MTSTRRSFYAAVFVIAVGLYSPLGLVTASTAHDDFNWEKLNPSNTLDWTDCFDALECARLNVPLNYSEPNGRKAVLAMIRAPSPLNGTDAYRGPILFNPGGPGGSDVASIRNKEGRDLHREIVGPKYDLVSFDPRGVASSTPRASFFKSEFERQLWKGDNMGIAPWVINTTIQNMANWWSKAQIIGQMALDSNEDNYLQHINTENTARDMLRIIEVYGREKLSYWGFSYGTILGATFATILPDKVERIVLDGVSPTQNYYEGLWNSNLIDTSKTMQWFYDSCFAAGPSVCSFWSESPSSIDANLSILYEQVKSKPIPVYAGKLYGVIDYAALREVVFLSLRNPYEQWPQLADALTDLRSGNGKKLLEMKRLAQTEFECSCDTSPYEWMSVNDGQVAIACNDAVEVHRDLDQFLDFSRDLYARSDGWGDAWEKIPLQCSNYPNFGKKHFQGPVGGNTSFPLLVIGNTADPVTPLYYAKLTHAAFPGSALLTQDSPGHCSTSAPSLCTAKAVRAYFLNGTLPEEGTICSTDGPIFVEKGGGLQVDQGAQRPFDVDERDRRLLAAADRFSRTGTRIVGGPLGI